MQRLIIMRREPRSRGGDNLTRRYIISMGIAAVSRIYILFSTGKIDAGCIKPSGTVRPYMCAIRGRRGRNIVREEESENVLTR